MAHIEGSWGIKTVTMKNLSSERVIPIRIRPITGKVQLELFNPLLKSKGDPTVNITLKLLLFKQNPKLNISVVSPRCNFKMQLTHSTNSLHLKPNDSSPKSNHNPSRNFNFKLRLNLHKSLHRRDRTLVLASCSSWDTMETGTSSGKLLIRSSMQLCAFPHWQFQINRIRSLSAN